LPSLNRFASWRREVLPSLHRASPLRTRHRPHQPSDLRQVTGFGERPARTRDCCTAPTRSPLSHRTVSRAELEQARAATSEL
jgi:hypothetical protein